MNRRLLALVPLALVLAGCATKRDLRELSLRVDSLRMAQDRALAEIAAQNRVLLDSIGAAQLRLRGDLGNQLVGIERQLVQIQELTGQGQQAVSELRESIRAREEAMRTQPTNPSFGDVGDPDELFVTSMDALQRGSYTTAATGFEEFVRAFSDDERAPEAQLLAGEGYEGAEDEQRAIDAYARVLELFPNSSYAPTALYRAALIELDRDEEERARAMLEQVIAAYPDSPEARLARDRLRGS